jgi:hypothetical protein
MFTAVLTSFNLCSLQLVPELCEAPVQLRNFCCFSVPLFVECLALQGSRNDYRMPCRRWQVQACLAHRFCCGMAAGAILPQNHTKRVQICNIVCETERVYVCTSHYETLGMLWHTRGGIHTSRSIALEPSAFGFCTHNKCCVSRSIKVI